MNKSYSIMINHPIRAQAGVLKDLWGEVLREEQQRHDLMLMFPDLQLSPGTTEPDRARSASPRSDSIQF